MEEEERLRVTKELMQGIMKIFPGLKEGTFDFDGFVKLFDERTEILFKEVSEYTELIGKEILINYENLVKDTEATKKFLDEAISKIDKFMAECYDNFYKEIHFFLGNSLYDQYAIGVFIGSVDYHTKEHLMSRVKTQLLMLVFLRDFNI